MAKAKILITGASGFVGMNLTAALKRLNYEIVPVSRKEIGDLGPDTDWSKHLVGVEIVLHLAAYVHQMKENAESRQNYSRINTSATFALARAALKEGARQFIFLSSAKVLGDNTKDDHIYSDDSRPDPQDPYSRSKWEGEQGLLKLAAGTNMSITTLRPPLIYGPGVKANFLSLLNLTKKGVPLPLGNIKNKRSLIGVRNLISAIVFCIDNPSCLNKAFLVSDGLAISTSTLIQEMATVLKKKPILITLPRSFTLGVARALGRESLALRLMGSFHIRDSHLRALGWKPPFSLQEELTNTIA